MSLIHIGDGIHVEVEEGSLRALPPEIRPGPRNPNRARYAKTITRAEQMGSGNPQVKFWADVPAAKEWHSRDHKLVQRIQPRHKVGRQPGHSDGFSAKQMKEINERIVNILMNEPNIQELIASLKEDNPVNAFAMAELIKMAAQPGSTRDRTALLKIILEFNKSRPATKSEVQVAQQDTWATLLHQAAETARQDETK